MPSMLVDPRGAALADPLGLGFKLPRDRIESIAPIFPVGSELSIVVLIEREVPLATSLPRAHVCCKRMRSR